MTAQQIRLYAAVRIKVPPNERVRIDHTHYDLGRNLYLVECGVGALISVPTREVLR
jgi:hypothetical protein